MDYWFGVMLMDWRSTEKMVGRFLFISKTTKGGFVKNFEKYEKLKKLNEQEESAKKQLKKEKQRLMILQNQRKDLERKARTHRLCQHGALLERYFPPDEFTDEMIRFLMDGTFNRQDEAVRDLMEEVKDIFQSEEKDKTVTD